MTPLRWVDRYQHFGGTYCICIRGRGFLWKGDIYTRNDMTSYYATPLISSSLTELDIKGLASSGSYSLRSYLKAAWRVSCNPYLSNVNFIKFRDIALRNHRRCSYDTCASEGIGGIVTRVQTGRRRNCDSIKLLNPPRGFIACAWTNLRLPILVGSSVPVDCL